MQVRLSPEAQERVESLVREGVYPSVDAAIEAAVQQLDHPDFDGIDIEEMSRVAEAAHRDGTAQRVDDAYLDELNHKVQALIASRSRQQQ